MNSKTFSCDITNYSIKFFSHDNLLEAIMGEVICDYKYPKAYFLLLRNSIENLKKLNIKKIKQYVPNYDWNNILKNKTTWKKIKTDKFNNILIICNIDDFLNNMHIALLK